MTIAALLADLSSLQAQTITVSAWVRSNRAGKGTGFLSLNDGSCMANLQAVYTPNCKGFDVAEKAGVGSALRVTGTLVATPGAKQPCEIQVSAVELIGDCPPDYPLQKNATAPSFCAPSPTCAPAHSCIRRCFV